MTQFAKQVAVTPDDSGVKGCPQGLLLSLTHSENACDRTRFDRLWIGATGNVAVRDKFGNVSTLLAVPTGTMLDVRAERVMSTNTTATSIVAITD